MIDRLRRAGRAVTEYVDLRVLRWRTGTTEGQWVVAGALALLSLVVLGFSLVEYASMPVVWFLVPVVVGGLMLRHRQLVVLVVFVVACMAIAVGREAIANGTTGARISTLIAIGLAMVIVVFESSRNRSGLPSALGEAMLADLRDRLQAQGKVPALPDGWTSQSAVLSASGGRYAGDFLVANLSEDESKLEMILVDVCGKGVAAGTQSLQFAGALGGLIGALPQEQLFLAANDFLLRQRWDEGFATAVHVIVDMRNGAYSIISAGHPPAMTWDDTAQQWTVDKARGVALGITDRPEFHQTQGVLELGDALLFYTDGVVESRSRDVMTGIAWLTGAARDAIKQGFEGAPRRILAKVDSGDDDRAVLMLSRVGQESLGVPAGALNRRAVRRS